LLDAYPAGTAITYKLQPVEIDCVSGPDNIRVDWNVCFGYDTASSENRCQTPVDAVGNVPPSKCKCGIVDLPIEVESELWPDIKLGDDQ
jgi:hypothetical protein